MANQIEIALTKHFYLLSKPVVISKVGEPLLVRFLAANVPVRVGVEAPTASAFPLQIFSKTGKQMGTCKAVRISWDWENPNENVAEIERFMLKQDFGIDPDQDGIRSMITTEEHLKEE